MTRQERQERPRNNSASSFHSLHRIGSEPRYGTEPANPGLASAHGSSSTRNAIQMPSPSLRTRNKPDRDSISPGSFPPAAGQLPPHHTRSPPKAPPFMSDHRRELAVLQTPQFVLRQNPPSAASSPANGMPSPGSPTVQPSASFLNQNIFDTYAPYEASASSPPGRPGTAPSAGSQGPTDTYVPDETRRPSVASVVTNASSTASTKSSKGRSFYNKVFGDNDNSESRGSSETSLPANSTTPRSYYGGQRPTTPSGSRPRTPAPPDVVPFLYQDPDDIGRLGDAPVHETPVQDREKYQQDDKSAAGSHPHRLHLRGRKEKDKERDNKYLDKELPPRPSTASKDSFTGNDYRKGLKLHLDGTASSHSSQTRLIGRSGSPTPSMASTLSNNGPRSPGEPHKKALWDKMPKIFGRRDKGAEAGEKDKPKHALRQKRSEPLLNSNGASSSGVAGQKRGSAGTAEYANPRVLDYAPFEAVAAKKNERQPDRGKVPKRGVSYENNKQRPKKVDAQGVEYTLDTDLTNINDIVHQNQVESTPPGPNTSWFQPAEETQEITWEPPESWAIAPASKSNPAESEEEVEAAPVEEDEKQQAQYCIRVFRADSTFATLSCKLNASVTEVLSLLGRKSFLQDNLSNYQIVMKKNTVQRILGPREQPLKIQKRLLEQVGYDDDDRLDEIGREDHSYLVRFTFMMARTGGYSLDQDPGLNKVQKFSHVDLQGRNLLTIPITLYHKAPEIISLNVSRNLSLNVPKDFIQQCVNLRKIEFTGNEAERLPSSIGSASRLTYLDISNNRLKELDHASIEEHGALVALKMSNNRFASLPDKFSKFKSLRSLNLSSNYLTSFPTFICELVTLVDLDVSFNKIQNLPMQLGQLSALTKLTATNNRLSGSLPQTFTMLGTLKELDLRYNELDNIDVIAELPRLEGVVMSHNKIQGLQKSFQKLRALHLNSNPVTKFTIPDMMPTLKFLNLSNAKIAAISETICDKLPNLEKLILDKNHILAIPPQISKLKKLEHLSISNNDLAAFPKEIGQLQELRYLDAHQNNLRALPGEMWQMLSLQTCNLSSNVLREFPKPVLNPTAPVNNEGSGLSTPKEDAIPEEPRRPSQQSGGLLSVGAAPTPDGRKASIVSIYGPGGRKASVISKSSTNTVSDSGTLTPAASRKDSAASSKMANTFSHSLRYLHLADNRLSDVVFEELSLLNELRILDLSYNDLDDIPSRALSRMGQLNELYLSGNMLTSLPAEDLENIPKLRVLHINGNKFQTLPAELGKLRNLLVLDVGNNALKYNISNWPYDWNWNWNLELKYLNLSGNKRLEIKPNRAEGPGVVAREKSITDFSALSKLRILGLMDVTLTIPNVPEETEDRRVRLSDSTMRSMSYGMADSLGRSEHLSLFDMVRSNFRGYRDESIIGLFDGQTLSSGGSKVSKYLHAQLEFFLKDEIQKLRPDETRGKALRRAFLNLNKELATTAAQTLDDKTTTGATRHPSTGAGPLLGPDDLVSGGVATVAYLASNDVFVANVGNAMAMFVQSSGEYKLLTKRHDPGSRDELDRIRDAGGYVSRTGKLNETLDVSRAFGYFQHMPAVNAAPYIHETKLTDQDELLIIANQELWEYVSYQTAADIARQDKSDLMRAAHKLRDFAIAYGATDKIMVMVLGVGDLKKAKNRMRTQSVSIPGQEYPADDLFPRIVVRRNKRVPKSEIPENSELARLDAEVKAPEGELAMVFTDIKNSTLMWETFATAMRSAIRVHNNIMRRQLRIVGGYEVKTEGDAFMVCFPTATSALLWCFSVQAYLLDAPWPNEILESEHGREVHDADGNLIYRGLSVRMGIHWGSPVCEPDPITRRMDYFGPMVNRASRISAEADGGLITASSDMVAEVTRCVNAYQQSEATGVTAEFGDEQTAQAIMRELRTLTSQGFDIKELGERKLKGLENPEFIYYMYPQSLAGRLSNARSAVEKTNGLKLSVDPAEVWALWDISLRLEVLCSTLNTGGVPQPISVSTDMNAKLRSVSEGLSDQVLLPLFEHIVTRIENAMTTLYLRRLLMPESGSSILDTAAPLVDLIGVLENRIGSKLRRSNAPGSISLPSNRISEIDLGSPSPQVSPTNTTHSVHSNDRSSQYGYPPSVISQR